MRRVDKPWGHEIIWAETPKYVGKVLHIEEGKRLSLQYHVRKEETLLVSSGTLLLESGTDPSYLTSRVMNPGDTFHVPPGLVHRMSGITTVDVVEVSTPELDDVVRVSDDHGRA